MCDLYHTFHYGASRPHHIIVQAGNYVRIHSEILLALLNILEEERIKFIRYILAPRIILVLNKLDQ